MAIVNSRRGANQRTSQRMVGISDGDLDIPPVPSPKFKSIEEIVDDLGFGTYQIHLLFICGGSRAVYGSVVQLMTLIQGCIMLEWGLDEVYESVLTGSIFAGQIFGMLTLGPLADYYGRRPIILVGWALILVFGLLACLATDIWYLIACEVLVGVGIGAIQALTYSLFLEAVPVRLRSRVMYTTLFTVLGELYVISVAWGGVLSIYGWRWLSFYAILPLIIISIYGFFVLEESARWLVTQGKIAEARKVLTSIALVNNKVGYSIKLKETPVSSEKDSFESFAELFSPQLWDTTLYIWAVQLLGYFTVYCIFIVLVDFFEDSADCSYEYGWIFFATFIESLGILGAFSLVFNFGRGRTQSLLWISTSLFLIGWLVLQLQNQYWPSLAFLFATKITVSGGAAALWLHTAELYPVKVRATGHSAANIMAKVGSFAAVFWVDAFASVDASNFTIGTCVYLVTAALAGFFALQLRETKTADETEKDQSSLPTFEDSHETDDSSAGLLSGNTGRNHSM